MQNSGEERRKRLLVTASTFPRWVGDTEPRFVLDMSSALAEYYDVTVLVPAAPGAADEEEMDGVRVVRYHYFPVRKWETLCYPGAIVPRIKAKKVRIFLVPFLLFSLWRNIRKLEKDVDMVHAHWLIPQGIIQSFCKKPYLVTGHGSDVVSMNKGIMLRLKRRCLKRASYVTYVSRFLDGFSDRILHVENKSVLPMGVKVGDFGRRFRKEDLFGQGNRKTVLFVGRLAEIKGVNHLINAMEGIDAKLIIAGDGPLRADLEKQAKDLNVDALFLGSKTHDELKTIYASSDIFVSPSIKSKSGAMEGLGLVNLEAMSSGIPVIASKYGGIVEIIEDHKNGLLCAVDNKEELHNAIEELLKDEELADRLAENALETVKKYDYSNLASEYGKCLEKMLE